MDALEERSLMRVAIRTILLALLLGVLTTIAVAQAFALRRSPFGPGATGFSSSGSVACAYHQAAATPEKNPKTATPAAMTTAPMSRPAEVTG